METTDLELNLREAFPFEPYDIQMQFAKQLYNALNNKSIGFFESPTGTVSISIIVAC